MMEVVDVTLIGLGLSALGVAFASVRLVLGPTLGDRVAALDLLSMLLVGILVMFSVHLDEGAYLDAALALALVSFLATVAFARYIDRSPKASEDAARGATEEESS